MSTDRSSGSRRKGNAGPARKGKPGFNGLDEQKKYGSRNADNDEGRPSKRYSRDGDNRRPGSENTRGRNDSPRRRFDADNNESRPSKRYTRDDDRRRSGSGNTRGRNDNQRRRFDDSDGEKRPFRSRYVEEVEAPKPEEMPLNKFIAHCGICSRRDAAELVKEGKIKVNGKVELQPGYKVQSKDKVAYNDKVLHSQKDLIYILLNKPKNHITTTADPKGRKTVMDLLKGVKALRVYPVGRLDRNTTGLLLLTNDGELAQKLSHPKYNIKKVYQVTLDKPLTDAHFDEIVKGLTLEDGKIKVDALAYLEKKNEIGIEIHSGRNRIVRRIFEHLGYTVDKLDRVMYAGLTKKNIPRGKWRELTSKEVITLKHFKN